MISTVMRILISIKFPIKAKMNYIGSKLKLIPFLHETIYNIAGNNISQYVFCDIFAGTGVVGRSFKPHVRKVISNDCEYYSYVLNRNYIGNHKVIPNWEKLIHTLNSIPTSDNGFIYKNYCIGGNGERQYFSDYNGQKIDTIRSTIELWKVSSEIDDDAYFFLLCSLLESADKLANTASVYGAYLKQLKKTAQKQLILEPATYETTLNPHETHQSNANDLIKTIEGDILYMDPPYNQRQYGANYHMLNTIAEYKPFTPSGKTGLRPYTRSSYCNSKKVSLEFEELVRNAKFKYIFLSYNNEGLMSTKEIQYIMQKYGRYHLVEQKHQRFKADKTENRNHKTNTTIEYLHILEKE